MAGNLFVRRDIWTIGDPDPFDPIIRAYAAAVITMQARDDKDPTSWGYQAAIHGTYAVPKAGDQWNSCQHRGWFFLPWHRMYLYWFERIVRAASGLPSFALPYWNYDRGYPTNTLPRAFRTEFLPGGAKNPLYLKVPIREEHIMDGWMLSPLVTSAQKAMNDPNFSGPRNTPSFGGAQIGPIHNGDGLGDLENTPHNQVHGAVGGDYEEECKKGWMSHPNCAALDPIFWLHHANIDRLWTQWIARPGHENPTDHGWRSQRFSFFDETGESVSMTAAEILDTVSQLGYTYDDAPAPIDAAVTVSPATPPPPSGPPALVAASDEQVTLTGNAVSVSLTPADAPARDALGVNAAAGRAFLNVEDIRADHNPGRSYAVYLTSPNAERHVGNVSLFGIEEMKDADRQHAAGSGFNHTFDVTDELRDLQADPAYDADKIEVQLRPITLSPPPGIEVDAVEHPHTPITVGRVSLFVG